MRRGILVSALASGAAAIAAGFGFGADAAEFGAGPWIKGGTDIFAGVVPSQPGFYSRTDITTMRPTSALSYSTAVSR